MTIVNDNATICGECCSQRDAYERGKRDQWEQSFTLMHARLPTDRERLEHMPMGPLGPRGYPGCARCGGRGVYMEEGLEGAAMLSRTMGPPGTPLHLAATDPSAPPSKLQA